MEPTQTKRGPIIVEQDYDAPVERVWDAISQKEKMRRWFFETISEFTPEVGHWITFNVHSADMDFLHVWRVMDVEPYRRFTLEWQYGGYPGDSYVTFELFSAGTGTHLRLTHRGQDTFPPDGPAFTRERWVRGWRFFICERLKAFVEG